MVVGLGAREEAVMGVCVACGFCVSDASNMSLEREVRTTACAWDEA